MRVSWLWFNAAAIGLVIFVAGVLLESRPAGMVLATACFAIGVVSRSSSR